MLVGLGYRSGTAFTVQKVTELGGMAESELNHVHLSNAAQFSV